MASIVFAFPAPVAESLNLNVPGFAAASGGDNTVARQVPPSGLLAPVVAGLNNAGIQVSPAMADLAAPAAALGLWQRQFAPAAAPALQGEAPADPHLAGAIAVALGVSAFGQAANAFFQAAAANPPPADHSQIGAWVAQQQQAVHDYLFGG